MTHVAVVNWHGVNDLADHPFVEICFGETQEEATTKAEEFARTQISSFGDPQVQYVGAIDDNGKLTTAG